MSDPQHLTAKIDAAAVPAAVKSINTGGAELDKAARQIAEGVAVPALAELVKQYPAFRQLDLARAVDYVSASLVESMFDGTADDQDVVLQFDSGYVTVPGAYREVLQAGIVRYLSSNEKVLTAALSGGK